MLYRRVFAIFLRFHIQKLYKISIDRVGSYNEYTSERDAHIDAKREIDDQLMFEGKTKPKKKNPEWLKDILDED